MLLALGVFVLLAGAAAAGTNQTIDDETGDSVTGQVPQYTTTTTTAYTTSWNDGPSCTVCNIRPNKTECHGQSWHDATAYPGQTASVTFSFTGTAIYVYGIVPNTIANTDTTVNLTFTLDGNPTGTYFHAPDPSNNTAYNISLFSHAGLANGVHQLIATATPGPTVPSIILFDYAVYTYEEFVASESSSGTGTASSLSTSSTSPSSTTTAVAVIHRHASGGAIGGAVGGGLVVIAALLVLLLCLRRRRRPEQPPSAMATTADMAHSPPHPGVGAGMDPYAGYYMPPPTAYGTAPVWTSSPSTPAYHPGSYAHPESGSYASTDMAGSNAHAALRVDSEQIRTPFSHTPPVPMSWPLTDASLTSSGGPYYSPKSAPPSNMTKSTAPGSSDAPLSSPEALRRLPPAPAQSMAVRPHDSLLTQVGSIKTMSEVPPAYALS